MRLQITASALPGVLVDNLPDAGGLVLSRHAAGSAAHHASGDGKICKRVQERRAYWKQVFDGLGVKPE
jgi:hypothetical protein